MSNAEPLKPLDGDVVLCLCISQLLKERSSLYEATRKYWNLTLKTANKATHVVGIYKGFVKIVFDDMEWRFTDNEEFKGRIEFISQHPDGVDSPYLGKYFRMYGPISVLKNSHHQFGEEAVEC